jgi:hypothetical protein
MRLATPCHIGCTPVLTNVLPRGQETFASLRTMEVAVAEGTLPRERIRTATDSKSFFNIMTGIDRCSIPGKQFARC